MKLVDKGVTPASNEPKHLSRLSRFKQWLILSISKPDNFPVYLTALFTFLLASFTSLVAVFAYFAWNEAQRSTKAIEGQLAIMRMEEAPFVWPEGIARPVYDATNQKVTWDWRYFNYGKGVAYNVQAHSYIKIGDERYYEATPAKPETFPLPPGGHGLYASTHSRLGIQ